MPNVRRLSRAFRFALMACAAVACPVRAQPAEPVSETLFAGGTDESVWVLSVRMLPGARKPIARTFFGDTRMSGVLTSPTLPDRYGDVIAVAAPAPTSRGPNAAGVAVLYADGTAEWLTFQESKALPRWPGSEPPALWTGDATRPEIYAVGQGERIELPTTRPSERLKLEARERGRRAGPATTRPQPIATTHPAEGAVLMRLQGREWQFIAKLPEPAQRAARRWLSARDGQAHLFWRVTSAGEVYASTYWNDAWSAPHAVPGSAGAVDAWAAADRFGPILIVGLPTDESSDARGLRVLWRKDEAWNASDMLRTREGELRIDPRHTAVAVARGRVVLARPAEKNLVEIGESALDGDRTVSWSKAAETSGSGRIAPRPAWWTWAETFVVMIVVAVIVASRQEALAIPIVLPAHLAFAGPARRIAAALLDLAPSVVATLPLWLGPLTEAAHLLPRVDKEVGESVISEKLGPPWYLMVLGYAAWCLAWEWFLGTSPGKHLLGCRIVAHGGGRPTLQQLIVRNCVRVAEFGIPLVGLSTVFVLTVISRNRQRLGDLLAGTYVIRDVSPLARPVEAGKDEPSDE